MLSPLLFEENEEEWPLQPRRPLVHWPILVTQLNRGMVDFRVTTGTAAHTKNKT